MRRWVYKLPLRVRSIFRKSRLEQELGDELRFHLEKQVEEFVSKGMTAKEARNAALRELGGVEQIKEECRDMRRLNYLENFLQDMRYGLRTLLANRAFAATVVLSLSLGIGANIAIFDVINAVLLRSLPVEDPHRLVQIRIGEGGEFTNPLWEQVRDHQQAFSGVLAYSAEPFDLAAGGECHFSKGLWVNGDFFHVLGVPALLGRVFTRTDDRRGGGSTGPVAVISYGFWKQNYGGDPSIIGKLVRLNRHPFEIVGVTPPWFTGLDVDKGYDVAVPIGCEPILHAGGSALEQGDIWWLRVLGRIAPGWNIHHAEERMKAIAPAIFRATLPSDCFGQDQKEYLHNSFSLSTASTGFSVTGDQYRKALFMLMAIVGVVLLVACANIANLLLSRAAARQREISVRMAMGASRTRVIRQLLTESLLLSVLGTGGGFLLAMWGSKFLIRLISTTSNQLEVNLSPDWHLMSFTVAMAILTTLLFGLAPAFRATCVGLNQVLKENVGGAIQGSTRFNLGKALVVGQIALSLLLLIGAFLFLGTLRNLLNIDLGFSRQNILLVNTNVGQTALLKTQQARLFPDILDHLKLIPGVESASYSFITPISDRGWNSRIYPEGFAAKSREDTLVWLNRISSGFFTTLQTPLLLGRDFDEGDTPNSPRVMIINESAARHFFGKTDPIGKTIGMDKPGNAGGAKDLYQVVGIVKDAKYGRMTEVKPRTAYLAGSQDVEPKILMSFEIRSNSAVESLIPSIRSAIAEINRDVSLEFRNFETQVSDSLLQPRIVAMLSSIFGGLALLLSVVGLYGITAYAVARRRREIGIRIALGSPQWSVVWLMLRDVALLLTIGTAIGLAVSLALGRLIRSLLYGVQPNDPVHLVGATIILAIAVVIAAYLPARQAVRLDPMTVLREE